jgi:hypothetical protein
VPDAEHQNRVCLSVSRAKLEGNDIEDGLGTGMSIADRARLSPQLLKSTCDSEYGGTKVLSHLDGAFY